MELKPPSESDWNRAVIVTGLKQHVVDAQAANSFQEALHMLALQTRLAIGAHQCAISYIPLGNFDAAIHTHSFSDKYARYNSYDVMPTGKGIWPVVIREKLAVRMTQEELELHPMWKQFSDMKDARGLEHPPMRGWLATPVLRPNGDVLGILQLSDKNDEADFTASDLDLLIRLSNMVFATFELEFVNQQLTQRTEQVHLEAERFQALVDASAEIVWTTDPDGTVQEDSPSWRAFTGQTYDQWKGYGWLDAFHPDDRDRTAQLWQRAVAEKRPLQTEYRLRHVSGGWRWTAVRAVPLLQPDGSVRGWVGMNTDITEQKLAEDHIRQLNAELEQRVQDRTVELASTVQQLQRALEEIKSLRGLIPICSWCKKIRNDAGFWQNVEQYLQEHTEAQFTHGLCPECYDKTVQEFRDSEMGDSQSEPV